MEAQTLKALESLILEAHKNRVLDKNTPALVMASDQRIESIENLQEHRSRFRGTFATAYLNSFCAYVKTDPYDHGNGFVKADEGKAVYIFNMGDIEEPGHCDNRAVLTLKPTPAFAALRQINGSPIDQKTLVEWVQDWRDFLSVWDESDESEQRSVAQAIAALREVKLTAKAESTHTDRDFGAKRTALEEIEASAAAKLPTGFIVNTAPYDGFPIDVFRLRLSVQAGERPTFKLRWVQQSEAEERIGQEFVDLINDRLPDSTFYVGTFTP